MSKRNISYIKPQDPKFLQQLKQQIGYKEGPSVETKRQKLEDLVDDFDSDQGPDLEDEKPQIVVINSGDLTADEVAFEEKRLAKEVAEARADLAKPIIFRRRHKPSENLTLQPGVSTKSAEAYKDKKSKLIGKTSKKNTVKLSFSIEDEEEQ